LNVEFQQTRRIIKKKINCVSCGHTICLDDAYDDFEGPVKCYVSSGLLQIKTVEGMIKAIRPASVEIPVQTFEVSLPGTNKEMKA
jgi:hypothetical protein